ncbi:MAG: hypothetical protein IJA67_09805 [Oscillospiraceae bacterium]|nr:hypothetical protein [Oscillospiraceae bacterium]
MTPFILGTTTDLLGLPWAIRYIMDFIWVVLLVYQIRYSKLIDDRGIKLLTLYCIAFFGCTLVGYIVQFQSPLYYLWGVRNNFRFYSAFISFALFVRETDVKDYFGVLYKLFWLNAVVAIIQFLFFGYSYDLLGGLFGVERGVNGSTNVYFCIMVAWSLVRYMEKKESFLNCAAVCVTALLIAALAELKFFFIEFVIIVGFSAVLTKFSLRKIVAIIGGLVAVVLFAALLEVIFPYFSGFFSVEWFIQEATSERGYTASGDLNRLNAVSRINELWLMTWQERLFGFGLGNCDTSSFAFVNTPFYEMFGHMHYTWISYAFMYLECGWIGLFFYFGFFVLVYFKATRIQKRVSGDGVTYCRLVRIMAILCVVISIYNSSLRTEAGYMAYFVLSIPFVYDREYQLQRETAQLNGSVQLSI